MKNPVIKEAQKSGKLTILFDSGIRTGPDILKAIALGAQAVLRTNNMPLDLKYNLTDEIISTVGRPWLYGSIIAGQAGVEQVIQHTVADLDTTLGLAGWTSIDEIRGQSEEALQKVDF